MAIAIPRGAQQRRLPWWTLLFMGILALSIALSGSLTKQFAGTAQPGQLHPPTLRIDIPTTMYGTDMPITGEIKVTATEAASLSQLLVTVFPVGARQAGRDETTVRTRQFSVPVPSLLAAGATTRVAFSWDQRRDDGTLAPRGDYVVTARLVSAIEQGNEHASTTGYANEAVVTLH